MSKYSCASRSSPSDWTSRAVNRHASERATNARSSAKGPGCRPNGASQRYDGNPPLVATAARAMRTARQPSSSNDSTARCAITDSPGPSNETASRRKSSTVRSKAAWQNMSGTSNCTINRPSPRSAVGQWPCRHRSAKSSSIEWPSWLVEARRASEENAFLADPHAGTPSGFEAGPAADSATGVADRLTEAAWASPANTSPSRSSKSVSSSSGISATSGISAASTSRRGSVFQGELHAARQRGVDLQQPAECLPGQIAMAPKAAE